MLQLMREKVDIRLRIGHDGVNPEPHIVRAFLAARGARARARLRVPGGGAMFAPV